MTVYLVGAGPGDPKLLTVRAAELLAQADVVVFDRLIDPAVLAVAPPAAEMIDVGKQAGEDSAAQEMINALLIERSHSEQMVVRLKGGDPFVFGRGGEEAEALQAAGVDYEIVPGISAITAVPAYAGVPLTMRGISSAVVVVTGHDPDRAFGANDWANLAGLRATLVILMGAARRGEIAERLIEAGRSAETPVLVVERGTTPRQRSLRTTLAKLGEELVSSPATIVVGEVAGIALSSYEDRLLFGWRVVVTRSQGQSGPLLAGLAQAGAEVIELPTIEIAPPQDGGLALSSAAKRLADFEWVVFSSENAVERLFSVLSDARAFAGVSVAAVGSQTASCLGRHGIAADLVASQFGAGSLLEAFPRATRPGRVLLPRSSIAPERLALGLGKLGWEVESVEAYQTLVRAPEREELSALAGADAIIFTSSSTVDGFVRAVGTALSPAVVVSIGPATSETVKAAGLRLSVEASPHSAAGVLQALIGWAKQAGRPVRH